MKSITVYAYRSNETEKDCTVKFTRSAYYDAGRKENGKVKATVSTNKAGQCFGTSITLRIKASESCAKHYTMRDFCDLAESVIEEKLG